ncbi:MAG TPA: hypothetical protein VGH19_20010 [Verrucomicrobiae bacterium]
MKAILICPAERAAVAALHETKPLVLVPMLGKSLLDYWMEHLSSSNITEAILLVADRPSAVREYVGEGERWGVKTEVCPVTHELTGEEAKQFIAQSNEATLVEVMDAMPSATAEKLFMDYETWFAAILKLMPKTATEPRIGVRETQPGVWTGLHDAISPKAQIVAPCWIGANVVIEEDAVVGPYAIIEDGVCVEKGAEVAHSVVMNETLVGEFTEIKKSIAHGNTLIHMPDGTVAKVPDEFLLSSLDEEEIQPVEPSLWGRAAAAGLLAAIAPCAFLAMARSIVNGRAYLRMKIAVKPCLTPADRPGETMSYFEVPSRFGWIRRWPQLWDAVCGRFALIGNRPLSPDDANELNRDFEKLWLTVPTGVISLADAAPNTERFGEKARAHSCYYAVRSTRQMDVSIFYAVVFGRPLNAIRSTFREIIPFPVRYAEPSQS